MDDTRIQNLMFLLAAAPIAAGCVITGADDVASDAGSGTSSPTSSTSGGQTDGQTDGMTGGQTDGATSSSTGMDTTEGPGDTTAAAETTGGTGEPPSAACEAYAATVTYCYDKEAGAAALYACAEYTDYLYKYGADCLTAFEDFYACLAALDCRNFGPGTGCEAESDAFDTTCFPA